MKKIAILFAALFFLGISANAADISAKSAVLYDCLTGRLLYEKEADLRLPMASTTKIMTALLAAELYPADMKVTIKPEWCGIEGSSMYLNAGEVLCLQDLIYGLLLMSGNDAAVAVASLSDVDFIALMNKKAADARLADTRFENPSGLDSEGHYSTARDLALLAELALKNPLFAEACATKQKLVAGRFMLNHNKLLFSISNTVGVKTGYTDSAGRCLVSAVSRGGRTLIAVTLNAADDWNDHDKLYTDGFYDMRTRRIVKAGQVGYAYLAGRQTVPVYLNDDMISYVTQEEVDGAVLELCGDRIVYGGITAGQQYGVLKVKMNGKSIAEAPVYFHDDIAPEPARQTLWDIIRKIF